LKIPAPMRPYVEAAHRKEMIRRRRRRVLIFVFSFPLVLLAISLYLVLGPQPPRAPVVLPISPQQAAHAEQQINAVQQALTSDAPLSLSPSSSAAHGKSPVQVSQGSQGKQNVSLRLSQADINAYLSGSKKMQLFLHAHGIQAIAVALQTPAQMTITAHAFFHGVTGNALVTANLIPDPQTGVRFAVTAARFGRFPPPVIKAAAQQIAAQLLKRPHHPIPFHMTSIQVSGSELIMTGTRQTISGNSSPP
jgi:hypothetical protein